MEGPEFVMDDSVGFVVFTGDVTRNCCRPCVKEWFGAQAGSVPLRGVAVDLKKVDFLDSSGIGMLVELKNHVERERGWRFALCEASNGILNVINRMGMEQVLRNVSSRQKVIEKFRVPA